MILKAASIDRGLGDALRRGSMRGEVLSAHREAAYLDAGGGRLIVLAREEAGNGPGYVLLPAVTSFAEGGTAVVPGEAFETEGSVIRVGGGRVEVETGDARAWDSALNPCACPPPRILCARAGIAHRCAEARDPLGWLGRLPAPPPAAAPGGPAGSRPVRVPAAERAGALSRALAADDPAGVEAAAAALIGLGEGLTPSCDDMLVGLAAILRGVSTCPWCGARARRAFEAVGAAIARRAERTTPVSRHFLDAAAQGRFTERVKDLVGAILDATRPPAPGREELRATDEKRVAAAAERVLEYGATSGADLIAGIELGCLAVAVRRRVRRQ